MKGIIFVKFCEFVETTWSDVMLDDVIVKSEVPSQGAYVSTMTYDDSEMFALVGQLCELTDMSLDDALIGFGKWVFSHLYASMPGHAHCFTDVFSSLKAVQSVIHVEVKKLNPDVILPEFDFISETKNQLRFEYKSPRNLSRLCEGLIWGLSDHTGQKISIHNSNSEHRPGENCIIEVNRLNE